MRKQKHPGKMKQWRTYLTRVIQFATAFCWLVRFILTVLQILKLWGELTG